MTFKAPPWMDPEKAELYRKMHEKIDKGAVRLEELRKRAEKEEKIARSMDPNRGFAGLIRETLRLARDTDRTATVVQKEDELMEQQEKRWAAEDTGQKGRK